MPKSERKVVREFARLFRALEDVSSEDLVTLSAVTMLHCIQFTRIAGSLVKDRTAETAVLDDALNSLQGVCRTVCSALTDAPSAASIQQNRIVHLVAERLGVWDNNGIMNTVVVERQRLPDVKLPGVIRTREEPQGKAS